MLYADAHLLPTRLWHTSFRISLLAASCPVMLASMISLAFVMHEITGM